jgi:hypothetical protein
VPAQATSCGYTKSADGTAGPVICKDGNPNTKVKKAITRGAPAIMALGMDVTRKELQAAVCSDRKRNATNPMLYDAIEYQAARYDWSRSIVHPIERRMIFKGVYC